jgi:hypothetical protein
MPVIMSQLYELIGIERELGQVSNALRQFAQEVDAAAVGACHVTCSDESERECSEAFQHWFVRELLPELKPDNRTPFRSINLGARYEWGTIRVAEQHFATAASRKALKLLVVKINAHTAVQQTADGPEYGWLDRYGCRTTCCGALAALFDDTALPAVVELRETFRSGDNDRIADLADPSLVAPRHRALLAAVTSARLQAQRVVLDIQQFTPETPTVFLVLPCVTINRPGPDTELVIGQYDIDRTGPQPGIKYRGLADAPAAYRLRHEQSRVIVDDDQWEVTAR